MIVIGIDPGVETGLAAWDIQAGKLMRVGSLSILAAMTEVERWHDAARPGLFVIFEDARKRKWFGNRADEQTAKHGAGVREGVGSVKRDCAIWEEFLTRLGVPFEARYPHGTKMKAEAFQRLTGWTERTNEHARDAAMIVYGLNATNIKLKLLTLSDGPGNSDRSRPTNPRSRARPAV